MPFRGRRGLPFAGRLVLLIAMVGCWAVGLLNALVINPADADITLTARNARSRWRSDLRQLAGRWASEEGSVDAASARVPVDG